MSPVRDNLVRYCPKCSRIGDAPRECINCCPDGADAVMVPPEVANQAKTGFRAQFGGEQPVSDPSGIVGRLRGQLQNCVNHLERAKNRAPGDRGETYRRCIEGANAVLYETTGHQAAPAPDEREIARPGYAGITVWVGGQECTQVVDRTVLETSRADELLRLFENARHLLRTEKEGDGHA